MKGERNMYHELRGSIEECKTEKELLTIVEDIMRHSKKYKLDEYHIDKLEEIGTRKYENMLRERQFMMKNKKQGFNNFE